MDSPDSFKLTATNCETSSAPQDSPVFDFLSNLSPIQPLRGPAVTQGFQELNSPPLVFTSPRLNRHRPSTFLKRAQFPRASSENIDEDDGDNVSNIKGYRKQDIQLTTRLDVCNEKGTESEGPENDLTGSPTEFPEQFLNDIVNLDSVDPDFINNSCSETYPEENVVERECKSNSRTSEHTETEDVQVLEGITLTDKREVEKDTKQQSGVSFGYFPEADHSLTNQLEEDLLTENVEANQSYHALPGKESEVFVAKAAAKALAESSLKKGQNDQEAFQHRGIRRRCLLFEDAQHKLMSTPINGKNDEVTRSMLGPRNSLNSAAKIPMPSGIGLHLNSIVNAAQSGPVLNVLRTAQRGRISVVGAKKSLPVNDSLVSECSNSSILPLVESVSESIDDNGHENHASVGVTSPLPLSTYISKPSVGSIILNSLEDQSTPGNKRKCIEIVDDLEEFNESSPQMKRMKSLDPKDSDGCKRCNCKKSKCLKLYCDCFAAGIYCAGPCSCQGCFNKPEYEDTVIETRQKIESRDPLAFAPRVVKHVTEQPSESFGEDGANFTPSSARHKRGCKCKKSMCLKKYCECYQSNVGCSDGCRCEGCQNVFGQKGVFVQEYCPLKDLFSEDTNEATDSSIPEKFEGTSSGNNAALSNVDNLTPPTSALQLSNHGTDASKAWFPSEYSPQSSESNFTYVASPYMISSDNNNNDIVEILDLSSFNDEDNLNPQKTHYYPPNTPIPQFNGTKLIRGVELSSNSTHDETPEILKDSSTPHNGVNVCSPNKKRVSPPHGRPHEFGSSSSTGLRTGRRFILKAVPSFPPLTPCVDSRRGVVQQGNECQNQSVEK